MTGADPPVVAAAGVAVAVGNGRFRVGDLAVLDKRRRIGSALSELSRLRANVMLTKAGKHLNTH